MVIALARPRWGAVARAIPKSQTTGKVSKDLILTLGHAVAAGQSSSLPDAGVPIVLSFFLYRICPLLRLGGALFLVFIKMFFLWELKISASLDDYLLLS